MIGFRSSCGQDVPLNHARQSTQGDSIPSSSLEPKLESYAPCDQTGWDGDYVWAHPDAIYHMEIKLLKVCWPTQELVMNLVYRTLVARLLRRCRRSLGNSTSHYAKSPIKN